MNNRNFGKLDADNRIVYAPVEVIIDGKITINPTAEHYAAAGYLPIDSTKPEKLGVYFISTEYGDLVDGRIVRRYYERPIVAPEPINRHWTKLKLKTALATAGWLTQVKAILSGIEIAPGYSAVEAFADCDYIEERWPDAERWDELLDAMAAQLGKTRSEIDAFLDNVPTDNGMGCSHATR